MTQKKVPAAALRFSVGQFELRENGESAKSSPFRMVARSGKPIEHWYWGSVVHDLDGMKLSKNRVAIDYAHDPKEIIGYANQFASDSGDLVVTGALVPYKESDRASEIIHKQREGIPYEASINFSGDGIKIEEVRTGDTVTVNGYEFAGPGVVIREWPLRGIAICPYGADSNTSTEFGAEPNATVLVDYKESDERPIHLFTAAHDAETKNDEASEVIATVEEAIVDPDMSAEPSPEDEDEEQDPDDQDLEDVSAASVEAASATPEPSQLSDGLRFLEAFGDVGGVWFAQGKTFEEATTLFVNNLKAENEQLRQRLSSSRAQGEVEPVAFSQHVTPKPKARMIRIAGRNYEG